MSNKKVIKNIILEAVELRYPNLAEPKESIYKEGVFDYTCSVAFSKKDEHNWNKFTEAIKAIRDEVGDSSLGYSIIDGDSEKKEGGQRASQYIGKWGLNPKRNAKSKRIRCFNVAGCEIDAKQVPDSCIVHISLGLQSYEKSSKNKGITIILGDIKVLKHIPGESVFSSDERDIYGDDTINIEEDVIVEGEALENNDDLPF